MCARVSGQLALAVFALIACADLAAAQGPDSQAPASSPDSSRPWEIEDNSFFVEEAFNQDPGVVQSFFGGVFLQSSGWATTFTQEWPVPGRAHQLSYTIPVNGLNGADGLGDIALNYRYQLMEEGPGKPALSPRLTLLCPTGNESRGLGAGAWGLQMNLPASKRVRDFYFHGNAGLTWYPRVATDIPPYASPISPPPQAANVALVSPFIAGSTIYRLRPMLNLMLESVVTWQAGMTGPAHVDHTTVTILSPGFRGGWNIGEAQIIVGAALPITFSAGTNDVGVFTYFSYEAPFWKVKKP
jgi:hypothetical protein